MEESEPGAGRTLATLAALAFVGIGAGAVAAPRMSSQAYGLPAEDATSHDFVRAMGARDVVLGLVLLTLTLRGERRVLAASTGACALVAAADALIILRGGRRARRKSGLLHLLGMAALAGSTSLLSTGR